MIGLIKPVAALESNMAYFVVDLTGGSIWIILLMRRANRGGKMTTTLIG